MKMLRIGSRGSALALWQANWARDRLASLLPGTRVEIRIIRTQGDQAANVPFGQLPGKGFFVKEIEEALLAEEIDLAVHSMKDVPSDLPVGLHLAAVTEREDPRDVLVTRDGVSLEDLPAGARVGTGSPRRAAQLRAARADLRMVEIRGNVDTRVRRLQEGRVDAVVLAAAGLNRLGFRVARVALAPEVSLPAVGQGALGLEIRSDDENAGRAARLLDHGETAAAVSAERALLRALGGGCRVPIAGLAEARGQGLRLRGVVAAADGSRLLRRERAGERSDPEGLGRGLAEELLAAGAAEILTGSGAAGDAG